MCRPHNLDARVVDRGRKKEEYRIIAQASGLGVGGIVRGKTAPPWYLNRDFILPWHGTPTLGQS
jgi:hypothetical protein